MQFLACPSLTVYKLRGLALVPCALLMVFLNASVLAGQTKASPQSDQPIPWQGYTLWESLHVDLPGLPERRDTAYLNRRLEAENKTKVRFANLAIVDQGGVVVVLSECELSNEGSLSVKSFLDQHLAALSPYFGLSEIHQSISTKEDDRAVAFGRCSRKGIRYVIDSTVIDVSGTRWWSVVVLHRPANARLQAIANKVLSSVSRDYSWLVGDLLDDERARSSYVLRRENGDSDTQLAPPTPDDDGGGEPGGVPGGAPMRELVRLHAIVRVDPEYPQMARAAGIAGIVTVEVQINERGQVILARAIAGHPLLRDAAVSAARQWEFEPTTIEGTSVRAAGAINFTFALKPRE